MYNACDLQDQRPKLNQRTMTPTPDLHVIGGTVVDVVPGLTSQSGEA